MILARISNLDWRRTFAIVLFVAFVVPLGASLAIVTPPGGVADELAHFIKAEALASGQVIARRQEMTLGDGTTRMAAGYDVEQFISAVPIIRNWLERATASTFQRASQIQWSGITQFTEITPLALYLPVFYVPAAAALKLSRLIELTPFDSFLVARIANLLVYAGMGLGALALARRGHLIILCALSLPMEVSLAASLNQDGILVSAAVLATALLTRTTSRPGEVWRPTPSWLGATVLLSLISLAKIPYAGLLTLVLLPVVPVDRGLLRRFLLACLAIIPALLWAGYAMHTLGTPWPPLPAYQPGPLWPGPAGAVFMSPDPAAQFRVIAADPLRLVTLTFGTMFHNPNLIHETIGTLGLLNVFLPNELYGTWYVALAAACVATLSEAPGPARRTWGWTDAVVVLVALILCLIAIYMSQYLTWTKVGYPVVEGPTGRYFLPLLPALLFLLPEIRLPFGHVVWTTLAMPLTAALILGLFMAPFSVISTLYFG